MRARRTSILLAALAAGTALSLPQVAFANDGTTAAATDAAAAAQAPDATDTNAVDTQQIVVTSRRTRSVVAMEGPEIQKILPGVSPLKAIQTLPGVTYLTADPWGNNEQNISLFIHGFNAQQLGYTLDGVPLGDQTYGNFNGLSPSRALISENTGRVTLASGAGDLGTASTSNLGGTIDTFSSDPKKEFGATLNQTFGSYSTFRTFARIDSGEFGNGNSFYVSGVRQDARAWDFNGHQKGTQANGKFVHDDSTGKFTAYFAYSDKIEPNEDATSIVVRPATATAAAVDNRGTAPYTRPFLYPNYAGAKAYYQSAAYAAVNAAPGSNYRNYYSDAQRTDYLGYIKYDWKVSDRITWSNQAYFHHNDGAGVVSGPITAAGLPGLFSFYYPNPAGGSATSATNLARLSGIFGGSGLAARTTEYRINRGGVISTLKATLGNHEIELGGWWEHLEHTGYRRWYPVPADNGYSPYVRPEDVVSPLITQYGTKVNVDEYQTHIQDSWHIRPNLTLMAGFKSTFQDASQAVPVQPIPGSFTGSRELPTGRIVTKTPFLPQVGASWDINGHEQLFANVQKNVRQFQTSATAGLSPFALGSQTLFDFFKQNTKPETSWTYEGGLRTARSFNFGPITGFEGQVSYYHVDFKNRLLAISPTSTITAIVSGATILQNVGSVKTDGVDIAGTLHFGPHFSIYNALSYNNSRYEDNYLSGTTLVPTKGKKVPGSPDWLNKTVVSANYGMFDAQLIGDYLGKRYATFTDDLWVKSYFTMSAQIGANIPMDNRYIKKMRVSLNVTNLTNKKAESTLSVGAASQTYNFFPLAPRQWFGTVSFGF
jgi:iron complex outermembrane recepter protein